MIPATVVDVGKLLQVVEAAALAGVGVSIAFSLVIYGFVKAGERNAQRRHAAAGAHLLLGALGLAFCAAAIVFGITTMLSK